MPGMNLDEFLDHSAGSGMRGNFLKNWRKGEPPKIVVWLHLGVGLGHARWSHNWPRVVVREDRDTGEARKEVWGGQWVCHEREFVLRKQRYRNDDGSREVEPVICPLCRTIEVIHKLVREGDLDWLEPVFRFRGSGKEHDTIIRAGGIYNAYSRRDLTKKEKGELREAGVRPSEAWRENATARCQYTFAIVNNDNPEDGVQITDEAEALGNAMKRVLKDKIEEVGREDGNPLRKPYPFLWEYRATEDFEKKYRVVPKTGIELTDEIAELIGGATPDLSSHLSPGNITTLRTEMEEACLLENFPFDEIFGPAEKAEAEAKAAEPDGDPDDDDGEDNTNFPPDEESKVAEKSVGENEEGEELFICEACDFDELKEDDVLCPKCGAKYDDEGDLVSRPCGKCKADINLAEQVSGGKCICPDCGAIHDAETWKVAEPPKVKKTRRSAGKAAGKASTGKRGNAKDHVDPKDDLPWGGKDEKGKK